MKKGENDLVAIKFDDSSSKDGDKLQFFSGLVNIVMIFSIMV